MKKITRGSRPECIASFSKLAWEFFNGRSGRPNRMGMFVLLLAPIVAPPVDAAIYKWIDENGVTQYSATPPPDQTGTKVHIPPPPSSAVMKEAVRKLEDHLSESRKRDALNDALARNQANKTAAMERQSLQRCRYAKENLYVLQMQAPVFHLNDSGERVYVNDQDRVSRIEALQEQVASYCQ